MCVGDGANDIPMLKQAALGVAFNAKPKVQAQVQFGSPLFLAHVLNEGTSGLCTRQSPFFTNDHLSIGNRWIIKASSWGLPSIA